MTQAEIDEATKQIEYLEAQKVSSLKRYELETIRTDNLLVVWRARLAQLQSG